jgi:hypothetical protein
MEDMLMLLGHIGVVTIAIITVTGISILVVMRHLARSHSANRESGWRV